MTIPPTATHLVIVSLCGGIGCALRVAARDALMRLGVHPWWSIGAINLLGALTMGFVAGAAGAAHPPFGQGVSAGSTGLLAGWTTYSAFSMDVVQLWLRGDRRHAAALWASTIAGAPAVAFAGGAFASAIFGGQA